MQLANNERAWGMLSVALHWLVALTVFGLFGLGYWMTGLDYYHAWYKQGPDIHKSIGLILACVLVIRLAWRLFNPNPAPLPSHAPWENRLAHIVHSLLYLMLFAIIISGYLISTADNRAIEVFGWFRIPAYPLGIEQQEEIAGTIHWYLALTMMGVVGLHAAGALKHHIIDKDQTLMRMLRPGNNHNQQPPQEQPCPEIS